MHHPTDRIAHTTAFVTPVMEHWLEREMAQWVHPMKDQSNDPSYHERTLLPLSYISLPLSERGNLMPPFYELLYPIRKYVTAYTSCLFWFVAPVVEHRLPESRPPVSLYPPRASPRRSCCWRRRAGWGSRTAAAWTRPGRCPP